MREYEYKNSGSEEFGEDLHLHDDKERFDKFFDMMQELIRKQAVETLDKFTDNTPSMQEGMDYIHETFENYSKEHPERKERIEALYYTLLGWLSGPVEKCLSLSNFLALMACVVYFNSMIHSKLNESGELDLASTLEDNMGGFNDLLDEMYELMTSWAKRNI